MYGNGLANGEPSAQFKFDVWGEGWYSFPRSPADSMNRLVEESKLYSVVLRYDSDIATPDSNVTSWLSGNAVPLSYLHSYEGNKLGPLDLNGAYGLPVSDGEGNLNQDISGVSYQYDYSRQAEPALFYNSLSPTPNNRINDLYIGRKPTGEYYEWEGFKGDIYEILVFSSALSESDIDLINDYLNLRYGIEP